MVHRDLTINFEGVPGVSWVPRDTQNHFKWSVGWGWGWGAGAVPPVVVAFPMPGSTTISGYTPMTRYTPISGYKPISGYTPTSGGRGKARIYVF